MEEVDKILIQSLREIECQIDSNLQKISEFSVETLFSCVSQCLQLITGNKELPKRLPPNISTRFKVCGEFAQWCQSNGYKGEIGYQTFLSINEHETRKLLNFLIEKVPREIAVTTASTSLSPWEALDRTITNKIIKDLTSSIWIPHDLVRDLCHVPVYHPAAPFAHKSGFLPYICTSRCSLHIPPSGDQKKLSSDCSSFVFEQVRLENLANALLYENQVACWREKQQEANYLIPGQKFQHKLSKEIREKIEQGEAIGSQYEYSNRNESMKRRTDDSLLTRSRFMHTNVQETTQNDDEENRKPVVDHAEELEALKALVMENEETISQLEKQLKKLEEKIKKYEAYCDETRIEIDKLNQDMKVKKQAATYILSVDPETDRLQGAIEKLKDKMRKLEGRWTEVQGTLLERREKLNQELNNRQSKLNEKLNEINDMKAKGASVVSEIKEKDQQLAQLQQEYETHKASISKNDQSRTFFTKQILEIVKNTNKQKKEISKTNIEIRSLQKDLNRLTEKLERTFQVTDSQLFKDAKTDEFARKSYKMLVAFHSDCENIYKIVEEIGVIIREIRDSEDQIEVETQKNMTTNLETLMAEYKKMRDENNALKANKR